MEHVIKRSDRKYYYFKASYRGEARCFSLRTTNKREAQKLARRHYAQLVQFVDSGQAGRAVASNEAQPATVGEVLRAYKRHAQLLQIKPSTAAANAAAFLRVASVKFDDPLAQVIADIDADLAEQYERAAFDAALSGGDLAVERCANTVRSTLAQARSVLSSGACRLYKQLDLKVGDVSSFVSARCQRKRKGPARTYRLPPRDLIDRTIAEGKLLADSEPHLHAVFVLLYYLGLRASEAAAARGSWLERSASPGVSFMHIISRPEQDFVPKGIEGSVPMAGEVHDIILSNQQSLKVADDFLIPGCSRSARERLIKRDFAQWMRGIGWDREIYRKAGHELRKIRGSIWWTDYGPAQAQAWLRHASIDTTFKYYADLSNRPTAIAFD